MGVRGGQLGNFLNIKRQEKIRSSFGYCLFWCGNSNAQRERMGVLISSVNLYNTPSWFIACCKRTSIIHVIIVLAWNIISSYKYNIVLSSKESILTLFSRMRYQIGKDGSYTLMSCLSKYCMMVKASRFSSLEGPYISYMCIFTQWGAGWTVLSLYNREGKGGWVTEQM